MRLFRQGMHAAGVDPPVVEIEECASGNGEVNRFVIPSRFVQGNHILSRDPWRVMIHLVHKTEQRLVFFVQRGSLQVAQYAPDQFRISQQFRRNCGVGLQSKRAAVSV